MNNNINLAIDLRYAEKKNTGLTRFSKNIFLNLLNADSLKSKKFLLILPPKSSSSHIREFTKLKGLNRVIVHWDHNRKWRWKLGLYFLDIKLYLLLRKMNIGIYISPFMDPPIMPGIKIISTIHDITFLKIDNYFTKFENLKKLIGDLRIFITVLISKYLITVSKSTKEDLINRYKYLPHNLQKKISNALIIPNGITKLSFKKKISLPKKFPEKYFLYVGDRRPHKNIEYLINLINGIRAELKEDIYLVIAGSKSYKNGYLDKKIINNKVFIHEFIDPKDYELSYLYKNCRAFFLLSKSEGFGIPIIEAGVYQKKIIANNISSLRETAPSNSLFIKCQNINEDKKKVIYYLRNNKNPSAKEVLKKWKWQNSSKILCDFIQKIC
ncbi:putative glycosyl transferase, group 1 [Prochlorococcus marinus subsp. pastoris str. CCMP1986]|uniref:Putative glycosyl transferase, group 1 n=1 Tax=Prochlorococcus marinus subsp. pastoris (strain CCMP1986 / NIES-2087 / MED4) TaxID=59919 RepID=Q7V0N3_PROMP|nr:glycosyltransferase family 1 protein [Prochlorococcus marinus]KGF87216.1 putative glycosyl transferase [Prochlorococcus marinus str. EQPAC1]CAE19682.1 putative glycosyl transferase, group 1 [Prochlorococcus marinus subsp. pastoris str. CCMP1986]